MEGNQEITANIQCKGEWGKLFDFAYCHCINLEKCTCSKEQKVPKEEKTFLLDHRSSRGVFIGSINFQSTIKKRKKFDCQKRFLSTEKNTSL